MSTEQDEACGHSPHLTRGVKQRELWKLCEDWMDKHGVKKTSDFYPLEATVELLDFLNAIREKLNYDNE
jgi:hypothetical protein